MPNIKSAKKRVEISEKNRLVNRSYRSELATALKKYNSAVSEGNKELVKKLYPVTVSLIDESVTRGVIHKNKADRKKAEVTSKYIALATAKPKKAPNHEVKAEEEPKVVSEEPAKKPATKTAKAKAETTKKTVKKEVKAETAEKAEKKTTRKTTAKKETK